MCPIWFLLGPLRRIWSPNDGNMSVYVCFCKMSKDGTMSVYICLCRMRQRHAHQNTCIEIDKETNSSIQLFHIILVTNNIYTYLR